MPPCEECMICYSMPYSFMIFANSVLFANPFMTSSRLVPALSLPTQSLYPDGSGSLPRNVLYRIVTYCSFVVFLFPNSEEWKNPADAVSIAACFLLDAVSAQLPRWEADEKRPDIPVRAACLGNEAGMIGAALLGDA